MASNDFFDNSTLAALPKGQKARAESVDAKYDAITVGFDKLPTVAQADAGTRNFALAGGIVNVYTLALTHVTAYSDGLAVQFRVDTAKANTGASSLNVNSVGAAQIVYPDDSVIIADDLPVGSVVSVRYSTALSKWVMQSVTQGNVNAAASSAAAAASDAVDTAADLVSTNQDTIDTAADVVLTNADVVSAEAAAVAAASEVGSIHSGRVSAAGVFTAGKNVAGWTSSLSTTGVTLIQHNLGHQNFSIIAMCDLNKNYNASINSISGNNIFINTDTLAGVATYSDFHFILVED